MQIGTEIRAGLTSFLTLSYILLVNPKVCITSVNTLTTLIIL